MWKLGLRAAEFPEKEYRNGIFVVVYTYNPIFVKYNVYVPHIAGRGPLRRGPVRRGSERPRVGRGAGNRAAGIPLRSSCSGRALKTES
jgi:hypothetical protein